MRDLGDFQRRQKTGGDPRIREVFSRLRQLLDLLEDIANHPHQRAEPAKPSAAPATPPPPVIETTTVQQAAPLFVTVMEARRLIGIGHTRIYELINDGRLETARMGGRRLVRYSSLRRLADGSTE